MSAPRPVTRALARGLLAALACAVTFQPSCRRGGGAGEPPGETRGPAPAPAAVPLPASRDTAPGAAIEDCFAALDTADAQAAARALRDLRAALDGADEQAAARAIVAFLRSRRDVPTGLGFRVGPEGVLTQAPTLRTALLDRLPGLDPDAALDVARAAIAAAASPDECALALRNIAWNDLDGDMRDELAIAFERVATRPGWSAHPTQGYLQSLDIAVELGDARTFTTVSGLLAAAGEENTALRHAAFIALDRMVLRDPMLLAAAAEQNNALPPLQRAALMARLDPSSAPQADLLAAYLSTPRDSAETTEFAALFPNGNRFHGNWMVTATEPVPSIEERRLRDERILAALPALEARLAGPGPGPGPGPGRDALATSRARLRRALATGPAE